MTGNVHPNPGSIFPCSVCAANVTWKGGSVQGCTCSKCVYLRCSLLFFSRFKTLGSSQLWNCPSCCIPAFSGGSTPTNTVSSYSDSSSLYSSTVQPGPICSCQCSAPPHSRLLTSYPSSAHFVSPSFALFTVHVSGCSPILPAFSSSSDSIKILQWNAGSFRARSTKLLIFLYLFCIQESNLNSPSSFRIFGYSAL